MDEQDLVQSFTPVACYTKSANISIGQHEIWLQWPCESGRISVINLAYIVMTVETLNAKLNSCHINFSKLYTVLILQ